MSELKVLQNPQELALFIEVLLEEKVKSYLEIGSKFGGSLVAIAKALPAGSRIVSVDLPGHDSFHSILKGKINELNLAGYDAHLFAGNSTKLDIVNSVNELGPFDAVFIDANHTLPYVTKDWQNYGPMSTRIVAFHDIGWNHPPRPGKLPIEVPILWQQLKTQYRHKEIKLDPADNGIGVLWKT